MFKFTNLGVAGAGADDEIVAENYSIENDGHLLAVQEAYEDLSDIMEAMADTNAAAVDAYVEGRNNGAPEAAMESFNATVMEGFLGSMKDKIVNMLKKMWAKVKAFFKSALQYFNALWMSGKKFAEKYEDEIKESAKELDGNLKIKMYVYKDDALPKIDDVFTKVNTLMTAKVADGGVKYKIMNKPTGGGRSTSDTKKEAIKAVCAEFGHGAKDSETMIKNIRKAFHNGKENPETITVTSSMVDEWLAVLTGDDLVDACKTAADDADSNFKDAIDKIEKEKEEADEAKNKQFSDYNKRFASAFVAAKDAAMKIFSVYKSLVSERESAYKSALGKVLHYSPKKKDDED